jgi:hypothetical protein
MCGIVVIIDINLMREDFFNFKVSQNKKEALIYILIIELNQIKYV